MEMFGLVAASLEELSEEEKKRYQAVYCGICRRIGREDGALCRMGLSYDMAFLSLVLMSLYEPEEEAGATRCIRHPGKKQHWLDNEYIRYGARMNVALACYNARDDWQDEKRLSALALSKLFGAHEAGIREEFPRQCDAIARSIREINRLEAEKCPNPDKPANAFGQLLGELMVYREDLWAPYLRQMGYCLGRFIYLADAAMDYESDKKKGKYNPFAAMGEGENRSRWEEYLVLAMAGCTDAYERLPLVQDKAVLDNILYSGVWVSLKAKRKDSNEKTEENHDH